MWEKWTGKNAAGKNWRKFQKNIDNSHNLYYTIEGIEAWLSLVERCVRDAEAASSNLVASISYMIRPVGQAVKTTPSHGVNPGSIPGQVICCCTGYNSFFTK